MLRELPEKIATRRFILRTTYITWAGTDETLASPNKYQGVLPNEPNFPLLAGHVHKQSQLLFESVNDYTDAIQRDPRMMEAYIAPRICKNDMQDAEQAVEGFQHGAEVEPDNGTAHLGLAFSDLQMRRPKDVWIR